MEKNNQNTFFDTKKDEALRIILTVGLPQEFYDIQYNNKGIEGLKNEINDLENLIQAGKELLSKYPNDSNLIMGIEKNEEKLNKCNQKYKNWLEENLISDMLV